jgi:hypothetical protein
MLSIATHILHTHNTPNDKHKNALPLTLTNGYHSAKCLVRQIEERRLEHDIHVRIHPAVNQ